MRFVFMGAGEIGLPSLRWMLELADHEVVGIYTQPDKKIGRKQVLTPPAVKVVAEEAGVPVFQPETFRNNESAIEELRGLDCDIAIVMAYGQILPRAVIEAPKKACINLHASLLPRHRGASPIQAAIRDGDSETGITLMHIASKLDSGDMILKERTPIAAEDTGGILHDRLADIGPLLLEKSLTVLESDTIAAEAQDESLVTYSGKLERDHGKIDWSQSADTLARLIRAYDPWPGTYTAVDLGGERRKLKIYPYVEVGPDSDEPPGTVIGLDHDLTVSCGDGSLILKGDLQLEGRKRMSAGDLLRGVEIPAGTILSSD
ncbi:MAG: methionyl-tRNA formyltransferase [Verrucomicrobiales bacterium]